MGKPLGKKKVAAVLERDGGLCVTSEHTSNRTDIRVEWKRPQRVVEHSRGLTPIT